MSIQQGADERRIAQLLRQRGVGPDATAHPGGPASRAPARPAGSRLPDWWLPKPRISPEGIVEPEPTERQRDWLDDIIDSNPTPAGPQTTTEPVAKVQPEPLAEEPKRRPKLRPARRRDAGDSSRQSLVDAFDQVPRRIRWLIYHASAAGAGWWIGWADWATDTAAWYAAGHWTTPSAWVLYGLGGLLLALYRRSRAWAWPAAWAAAVPVSSIVLGVLLYAPTQ